MAKKLTKRAAARQSQSQEAAADPAAQTTLAPDLQPPSFFNDPTVRRWLPLIALAILTLIAMYPTIHGVYIWDDDQWLTHNGLILDAGHLKDIWFNPRAAPHYYPLVFTTYWIEYRLFHGLGAVGTDGVQRGVGYHVDNLLLHIASAWLIFLIVKRLKLPGGMLGAWLSAAIFAIHPVSVESVAWIAERKNCLCGALFFASLYCGFKFFGVFGEDEEAPSAGRIDSPRSSWWWYGAALLLFVLSMFSKTTSCVVGPVLLLMIWWRRGRVSVREIMLSLPFFVIGAVMGALTASLEEGHVGAVGPEWQFSILQRIMIAGTGLWFYIEKLFFPYPVMQIYPRFDIVAGHAVANPLYYLAPAAFVALVAALYFLRKKITRGPVTALLFFAGVLGPALGFINFYTMIYTFVADHYQYFACIGVIVLAVETVLWSLRKASAHVSATADPEAPARFLKLTTGLVSGGIVLALVMLTNGVSQLYSDDELLWTFNAEHNDSSFEVHLAVGQSHLSRNPPDTKGAIEEFKKAAACGPEDWRPYNALGLVYLRINQPEEGMKFLLKSEDLMPAFVRHGRAALYEKQGADTVDPGKQAGRMEISFGPHFILGEHYLEAHDWDKAIAEYRLDINQFPGDLQAYVKIGVCYENKDDYESASKWYQQAIDRHPKFAMAWLKLGGAFNALGREKEADEAWKKALELDEALVIREIAKAKAAKFRQPN